MPPKEVHHARKVRYTAPIRRRKCARCAVIFAAVRQVILPSAVIFVLWTSDISRYMREEKGRTPHHPGAATCSECILLRAERLDALSEHSEERKGDNPAPQDTTTQGSSLQFTAKPIHARVSVLFTPPWGPRRIAKFFGVLAAIHRRKKRRRSVSFFVCYLSLISLTPLRWSNE